jgi:hypothetical protein
VIGDIIDTLLGDETDAFLRGTQLFLAFGFTTLYGIALLGVVAAVRCR